MEKHKCKLCYKSFANGRALGGHMRSHMLNLYVPPKTEQPIDHNHQLGEETESAPSSSSSSSEEENEDKGLGYGLRENPKKSIRLVDPEFSFAVDAGSVVLQDRESETESSKNPIHRRSKRIRKFSITEHHDQKGPELKMVKLGKLGGTESEPVSSISDTTPEEDVAYCLMMLSRDKWMREENEGDPQEAEQEKYIVDDEEEEDNESEESDELKYSKARARKKYKCETCKKVFRSYQALGGHRASHKKIKFNKSLTTHELGVIQNTNGGGNSSMAEEKVHECPVCYRVFSSGQALGGHKRSHVTGSAPITTTTTSTHHLQPRAPAAKFGESLIDLNLPAPIDDDEISQIELSAVSDAEFVNPIKQSRH
ncbi:zinc finger protein ZAT9-like [Cornus florida]|uniref:zinc finger protein ZAT9-like n=1 Tax=Cornus florida TaxID=4283 RepID=UPI00289FBF48|nr:zinc finger protein ZAT9-like [Cornus florida]